MVSPFDSDSVPTVKQDVIQLFSCRGLHQLRTTTPPHRAIKSAGKSKKKKGGPLALWDVAATQEGAGKGRNNGQRQRQQKQSHRQRHYVIGTGSRFDDLMSTVGATEKLRKKSWTPPGFCKPAPGSHAARRLPLSRNGLNNCTH